MLLKFTRKIRVLLLLLMLVSMCCYEAQFCIIPVVVYADSSLKNNKNAKKLWKHLKDKGATDWWAAATIGNAYAELGLKTDLTKNSSGYWGAFQFLNRQDDFKSWCDKKKYDYEDIVAQYEWFVQEYRGSCCKAICGIDIATIEKDTKYIKDAKSAAAYFAAGMEGCVCWSGITVGKGHIQDSAHNSNCMEFDFSPSGSSYGKISLQNLKGRKDVTKKAYKAFKGTSGSSSNDDSDSDSSKIQGITDEKDLEGMPEGSVLSEEQEKINMSTRDNLGIGEKYSLSSVGEGIEINNRANALDLARRITAFIGLVLLMYGNFLFVAMWLDKINTFIDVSVVKLFTFGLINYAPNNDDVGSTKYIPTKKLIASIVAMGIIGIVILSGSIFSGLSQFVYWFSQKFLY